ncbi:MAG: hypothetical protein AB1626_05010, partial [Candidatus Micrarchaeota archaeon]
VYGDAVANAVATIALSGVQLPVNKTTNSQGKASFADLPRGANATATARYNEFSAGASLNLAAARNNVTLTLLPPQVQATFKAVDFFTGADLTVKNPVFHVHLQSTSTPELANCTQTSSDGCATPVYSSVQYALRVTASDYMPTTSTFNPSPGSDAAVEVKLVPVTSAGMVVRGGLYDFDTGNAVWLEPHSTKISLDALPPLEMPAEGIERRVEMPAYELEAGKAYYLQFQLYLPPEASEAGFYFQAGDKTSVLADSAGILRSRDWNPDETIFAEARGAVTSTRGFTNTACGASESSDGLYKSVFIRVENNGNNSGTIPITVPLFVTGTTRPQVTFSYSAYAVTPDGVMRSPTDPARGTGPTPSGKWCKTAAHNVTFKVRDPLQGRHSLHCGLQACADVSYSESATGRVGGTGFAAMVPLDLTQGNVSISYNVFDFNLGDAENPTPLKITIPADNMMLDVYDPETRNQYTINVSAASELPKNRGKIEVPVRTASPISAGLADVFFDYGDKFTQLQSYLLLYGEVHATLTNTYYLSYDADTEALVLKIKDPETEGLKLPTEVNGEWSHAANDVTDPDTILLFTDPIMPGDAVYVRLDYDSLPPECRDTEIVAMPLPNCFEYDSTKQLLRFDASASNTFGRECPLYNVDPNQVNEYQGQIRFNVFCLGITAQPYNLKVIKNPAVLTYFERRTAGETPAVYKSDIAAEGYSTGCGEFPAPKIYLLANNKQLGSLDHPYLGYNGILHSVVDKVTEPGAYVYVVNEGTEQKLLLGSSNVSLADFTFDLNRVQVREVLEKTVFRRHDERPEATAVEKGFPYSAFSTRPVKYSWASLRLSSTPDAEGVMSPDFVTNYGEITDCLEEENQGVFVKSLNPRDNTWQHDPLLWETRAEVAKLSAEQYLQSTEFGSVCGFKLEGANATETALCGTGYWSCGGGCVLPRPIVFFDGTQPITDIDCVNDGRLVDILLPQSYTSGDESHGKGVGHVYMLSPSRSEYYLHTPSCTVWRYWKRGLVLSYQCEWLCHSDLTTFEAYDFIEPFSKGKQTMVTCPKNNHKSFEHHGCPEDKVKQLMAEELFPEGSYTLVSDVDGTHFEFGSAMPGKNLGFQTKVNYLYAYDSWWDRWRDDGAGGLCDFIPSDWDGSRHRDYNPEGTCDGVRIWEECIFTSRNNEVCEAGCGNANQPACNGVCYDNLLYSNGYCVEREEVCGQRGSTPCEAEPGCASPGIANVEAYVDLATNTCQWHCKEGYHWTGGEDTSGQQGACVED